MSKKALIFLFLKLFFCRWCYLERGNVFAGLKQDHEIMKVKDICPKFCNSADLDFQAQYRAQCHLNQIF